MITCRKALSELSNYLDGEIDPQLREELEKHVAKCPHCEVIIDTTRKTIQIYSGCEPYPLPQSLHDKLQKAIRRHIEEASSKAD